MIPASPSEERKNTASLYFKTEDAPKVEHGDHFKAHISGKVSRFSHDDQGIDIMLDDVEIGKGKARKRTMKEDMADMKKGKKADEIGDEIE